MATLALGAAFAVAGAYAGSAGALTAIGISTAAGGAALGFTIGTQLGNYLFQPTFKAQGPRINDLSVQGSEYGSPIPKCWGSNRVSGQVVWSGGIIEHENKSGGGGGKGGFGGGGGGSVTTYTYSASFAVVLCEGPVQGIRRIWADAAVMYDTTQLQKTYTTPTGTDPNTEAERAKRRKHDKQALDAYFASGELFERITVYNGSESQVADGLISADPRYQTKTTTTVTNADGEDEERTTVESHAPCYRGLAYIVFEDLQLEKFGNRIPNISCELYTPHASSIDPQKLRLLEPQHVDAGTPLSIQNDVVYTVKTTEIAAGKAGFGVYSHRYGDAKPKRVTGAGGDVPAMSSVGAFHNAYPLDGHSDTTRFVFFDATSQVWLSDTAVALSKPQPWNIPGLTFHALAGYIHYSMRNMTFGMRYSTSYESKILVRRIAFDGVWDEILNYFPNSRIPGVISTGVANIHGVPNVNHVSGFTLNEDASIGYYSIQTGSSWDLYSFRVGSDDLPELIGQAQTEAGHAYSSGALYATAGSIWLNGGGQIFQFGEQGQLYNTFTVGHATAQGIMLISNNTIITYSGAGYAREWWQVPVDKDLASLDVAHVVEDLAQAVGKTCDTSTIAGKLISGYRRPRPMPVRAAVEPLQQAFLFDVVEQGTDLKAIARGADSVVTVTDDEIVAGRDYSQARVQELELPRRVTTTYQSRNADYQQGSQQAQRIATASDVEVSIELPMVLEDDQGAEIAEIYLNQAWTSRDRIDNISLPQRYSTLEPTDVFTLQSGEEERRIRVTKITHTAPGLLDISGAIEDSEVYVSHAKGGLVEVNTDYLTFAGSTDLFILDIPLLASNHQTSGVYLAASGGQGWRGAVIYGSPDEQEYTSIGTVSNTATYGYTTTKLEDGPSDIVDYGNKVTVLLQTGELSSTSDAGFLTNVNAALIGDEIITFRDATLIAPDTYELAVLSRGRLGTEDTTGTHEADELFVLLDNSLTEVPLPIDSHGRTYYIKAVSLGQNVNDAPTIPHVYEFVRGRPYAPADFRITEVVAPDTYKLEWTRRARHSGDLKDGSDTPLVDAPETYRVEVYAADNTTLVSTADVTQPSIELALTAGQHVHVAQVSPDYGPGKTSTLTFNGI